MSGIVDVHERLEPFFPVGTLMLRLEVVPGATDWGGRTRATEPVAMAIVRMIVWDRDPETGARQIRDVKEQQLYMGWPVLYEDSDRVEAFCQALEQVLGEIGEAEFETLMPSDLVHPDALELRRAHTKEDFAAALRAKKRLGRWMR